MASRTSLGPEKQIIFVSKGEENKALKDTVGYWTFGPKTKHEWPHGDFWYNQGSRVYPSAWTYDALVARPDVIIWDPDMHVDEGL